MVRFDNKSNLILTIFCHLKLAMQPERVRQKSKVKSKSKMRQLSKKLQNVAVKPQHNQLDKQDHKQYLIKLKNELNGRQFTMDVNAQIVKCLKLTAKHPTQAFAALCHIYQHQPSQFFSIKSNSKECQIRPIFQFLFNTVQYFDVYPLMQRQRVVVINQNFIKWLTARKETLKQQQLNIMSQMGFKVMALMIKGERDRIVEHMLYLLLKIPIAVAHNYQNSEERIFCEIMVRDLMREIARLIDSNHAISHQTTQNIVIFHQKSFKMLVHSVESPSFVYPLADFGTLIFTSKHSQLSKSLIEETFNMLRAFIEDKRQQSRDKMDGSIDRRSFEENELKINATLLAASFLKFDTVLDPQSLHKKMSIIKSATLLTLLTFKNQIIRLVDELQKLDKALISGEIIKGMFQISKFCSNTNNKTALHPLIKRIQSSKQLSSYLSDDRLLPSSPQDLDPFDAITKGMDKVLFELLNRIEKSLCHYSMQPFMDLFIQNPYTFRSEYFINKTFEHQKQQTILKLMCGLTSKWLADDNKLFDFSFYLLHLIRKCISEDNMSVLGKFINAVTVPQLVKINLSIFKLSFEEDSKKYNVPESSSCDVQMACLTSGGYRGKFTFINQIMPNFSQQLMWRQLINHFFPSKNYMDVKSFYNIVHYELSDSESVGELISLFQSFIQQEQIEEVHATFHLLHCVLFRYQRQNMNPEKRKKYQSLLLETIITKSQRLLAMYDEVFQRRRITMGKMSMCQQSINDNMRCFDRLKRMNTHFLRSVHNWLEGLTIIGTLLPPRLSYEYVMETLLSFTKDNEYRHLHQVRYISHYCSEKYLSNILSTKIKAKLQRKELLSCNHLLALKDIMSNYMGMYADESFENDYCIQESHILEYYQFILKTPLNSLNQVELLKLKMIVLYQMAQLISYFKQHPQSQLFKHFIKLFNSSIKQSITQIALQNPEYVSKFSREFILQLKTIAIVEILKNIQTIFQILSLQQSYTLIFQSCFDKCVQIRFMIVNMLTSRFKHQQFQKFLYDKYHLCATLTIIAIFDINLPIKVTAKRVVESFKNFAKECSSLGLTVLLYAIKQLLILIYRNLIKQQYFTCVDTFLTAFHQLWLSDKFQEYAVYAFASRFIELQRISFMLPEHTLQGFNQTYYFQRISSDYYLQSEIKEYLRKEEEFSFQFPSNEIMVSFGQRLIQNLMYSLPFRMFAKMIEIIKRKPRQYRILKHKKNIFIEWKMLQRSKLVKLLKEKCDRNVVTFQV